jgi:thymidine kinase
MEFLHRLRANFGSDCYLTELKVSPKMYDALECETLYNPNSLRGTQQIRFYHCAGSILIIKDSSFLKEELIQKIREIGFKVTNNGLGDDFKQDLIKYLTNG